MKNNKLAFTLIELLVVVLIIGVLAAVALPQYNKAVKKARGAEALAVADAIGKAATAYFLENGTIPQSSSLGNQLDIELPQLSYFRYTSGIDGNPKTDNYKKASRYFNGFTLFHTGWMGTYLISPDYVILALIFNLTTGQVVKICRERGTATCRDYFNCEEGSVEIQVGTVENYACIIK